jgi:hypothetical protein
MRATLARLSNRPSRTQGTNGVPFEPMPGGAGTQAT